VLFLHQFDLDFAGGSGVYLRALTDQLRRSGHEVDVVSARRPDQYGCTSHELPFDVTLAFGPEKRPGETALDELSTEDLRALIERATSSIAREVSRDRRPDLIIANHINLMAGVGQQLSDRSCGCARRCGGQADVPSSAT
jgi:hypothetical protein